MAETDPSWVLRNLSRVSTQISYLSSFKPILRTQCCDLARRIRFLAPLFLELHDNVVLSSAVSFHALQEALFKAKDLLQFATTASQVFMILDREQVKHRFTDVAVRFEHAMSKISFDELDVSEEIKEQVALVTTQFRRAKEKFDPPGLQLYEQLLSVYNQSYDVNTETAELRLICEKLQFINVDDVKQESLALEKMGVERWDHSQKRIQDMSLVVLKKIQDFLMEESGNIIVPPSEDICRQTEESFVKSCTQSLVIPDEFRCPISLELMKDPVIICTGQTYERSCIKKWLEAGHGTCPKTQQILSTPILIPNHALYGLISSWCEANGVEPPKRLGNLWLCKTTLDGSSELVDLDILVSKLSSRGIEDQRSAVGEVRLLAKQNSQNRMLIAEAGAIPRLVDLLYTSDAVIQEHAVTALLNLSIYADNKERIMAAEAVPGILHVLENGSMAARENAAATFFSLSTVDENRLAIGASGAIQALVTLFCEGSPRGKLDAAKALFNLCLSQGNKGRAIRAGIGPKLIEMLIEPDGAMRDEALAIMAIVASHPDGKAAIGSLNVVSTLVELLSNGSPRNKENATSVLVLLCHGDPLNLSIVNSPMVINILLDLTENGSERARRKAGQLLELIGNHCEHTMKTSN
ncbi:U-box domain-containing protein 13-like isoform X1 [Vigna unguiculata]|uniref:U-box domain-containing protein 13-like isoform X1 n=1 Tax=Vigna unguiculata TaxID=3917 RepID=UPI001016ECF8|nr:U-box domain-containing protein 13-like isoform X1 [Vigna unguiculata]